MPIAETKRPGDTASALSLWLGQAVMAELPSYDTTSFSQAYLARIEAAFDIHLDCLPTERWITWRGHQVHVDDWSTQTGSRVTVILVHGAGGNGRLLAPFAAPLAEAGFRVIAPDLPGYGLTVPRSSWSPDYADWVDLVADLAMQPREDGPVFTYGLSLGGITALWAAQKAADTIAGVVVTTLIDLRDPDTLVKAARNPLLGRAVLFGFKSMPWLVDRIALPLAITTPLETLTTDAELARLFLCDPLLGRRRVPGKFFRSIAAYHPPRGDYALPCPRLLAHPGSDTWTPSEMSRRIFDAMPGEKQFVELSNGSHAPLESPTYEELNTAVQDFILLHSNMSHRRAIPS